MTLFPVLHDGLNSGWLSPAHLTRRARAESHLLTKGAPPCPPRPSS